MLPAVLFGISAVVFVAKVFIDSETESILYDRELILSNISASQIAYKKNLNTLNNINVYKNDLISNFEKSVNKLNQEYDLANKKRIKEKIVKIEELIFNIRCILKDSEITDQEKIELKVALKNLIQKKVELDNEKTVEKALPVNTINIKERTLSTNNTLLKQSDLNYSMKKINLEQEKILKSLISNYSFDKTNYIDNFLKGTILGSIKFKI